MASLLLSWVATGAGPVGATPRAQTTAALATVTVGDVAVVAPTSGVLAVGIPVTLSQPSASSTKLHYELVPGGQGQMPDVEAHSGTITFQPGHLEEYLPATILPGATASSHPCWSDPQWDCIGFSVSISVVHGAARVSTTSYRDEVMTQPASPGPGGIDVGDVLVQGGASLHHLSLRFPVTLGAPEPYAVSVAYSLTSGSALAGVDFGARRGTLRFPAGTVAQHVQVDLRDAAGRQPYEVLYLTVTRSSGDTVQRATGIGIIATAAKGVPDPLSRDYRASTLTQVASRSGSSGDSFRVTPSRGGTVVTARGVNGRANDRMVWWPAHEARTTDQETCATWASQSPTQAVGVSDQEGLVLRAATFDGITRAITVTKNIYSSAFFDLNVHLWNTSSPTPFELLYQANIGAYLFSHAGSALPWNVCARVVGATLQFEVWLPGTATPHWGDDAQGGSVVLPPGWDFAGEAGWYVGHLRAGGAVTYTNEVVGLPQDAPSL